MSHALLAGLLAASALAASAAALGEMLTFAEAGVAGSVVEPDVADPS